MSTNTHRCPNSSHQSLVSSASDIGHLRIQPLTHKLKHSLPEHGMSAHQVLNPLKLHYQFITIHGMAHQSPPYPTSCFVPASSHHIPSWLCRNLDSTYTTPHHLTVSNLGICASYLASIYQGRCLFKSQNHPLHSPVQQKPSLYGVENSRIIVIRNLRLSHTCSKLCRVSRGNSRQ